MIAAFLFGAAVGSFVGFVLGIIVAALAMAARSTEE
jgi:uncharacterized membrane protein